jgi:hypothetical protein
MLSFFVIEMGSSRNFFGVGGKGGGGALGRNEKKIEINKIFT